jgi:hypothetical protein
MSRARAFTLVEVLIVGSLVVIVLGIAFGLLRWGEWSTSQVVGPAAELQAGTRKALLQLIQVLQESIEVLRPPRASTLSYFLVRGKLNQVLLGYQVLNTAATKRSGTKLYDLHLAESVPADAGAPRPQRLLIANIRRLTFTSLAPGVLQIHLDLYEEGKTYSLLTTVRCRNIHSEAAL